MRAKGRPRWKIYLDMCAIQRPLDTPSQIRIALEAEAVLGLLSLWESGQVELVSSPALEYETRRNPHRWRREYAWAVLQRAHPYIPLSEAVEARAHWLVAQGFQALDALHVALAEAGAVDYFCTVDDKLRKRAQRLEGVLRVKVVSPLDLVQELGL